MQMSDPREGIPKRSMETGVGRLRIGSYVAFSGALSFPKVLFSEIPDSIELSIIDLQHRGQLATYLKGIVPHYFPVIFDDIDYPLALKKTAEAINRLDLDLFVVIRNNKQDAYDLLDRIDVPV